MIFHLNFEARMGVFSSLSTFQVPISGYFHILNVCPSCYYLTTNAVGTPYFLENVNFDDLIAIGVKKTASDKGGDDRAFSKRCLQCHFVNNFLQSILYITALMHILFFADINLSYNTENKWQLQLKCAPKKVHQQHFPGRLPK